MADYSKNVAQQTKKGQVIRLTPTSSNTQCNQRPSAQYASKRVFTILSEVWTPKQGFHSNSSSSHGKLFILGPHPLEQPEVPVSFQLYLVLHQLLAPVFEPSW